MKLLSIFAVTTTAFVTTALAQGASVIENDILAIDSAVRNFTAVLNTYQGGIREANPALAEVLNIHAVNRKAFADAQASAPLTLVQSKRVADAVRNSVGVSIPIAINLTKAKKPLFDQAQLTSIIRSTLNLLQYDHDTFSFAAAAKLDPTTLADAGIPAGQIAAAIADGMLFYAV